MRPEVVYDDLFPPIAREKAIDFMRLLVSPKSNFDEICTFARNYIDEHGRHLYGCMCAYIRSEHNVSVWKIMMSVCNEWEIYKKWDAATKFEYHD